MQCNGCNKNSLCDYCNGERREGGGEQYTQKNVDNNSDKFMKRVFTRRWCEGEWETRKNCWLVENLPIFLRCPRNADSQNYYYRQESNEKVKILNIRKNYMISTSCSAISLTIKLLISRMKKARSMIKIHTKISSLLYRNYARVCMCLCGFMHKLHHVKIFNPFSIMMVI